MSALSLYLQAQLLLALSLIVFRLVMAAGERLGARPSFAGAVRVAQLLVVLSVVAPIVAACIPVPPAPPLALAPAAPDGSSYEGAPALPAIRAAAAAAATSVARAGAAVERSSLHAPILVLVALGVIVSLARSERERRSLRRAIEESASLRRVRRVRIAASDSIAVPLSVWLRRTAFVVLPSGLLTRTRDTKAALAHELEHHRRRDTHWARTIEALSALCWPNPAIAGWTRTIVELQELACDEAVLRRGRVTKHEYGTCLAHVAESAFAGRHAGAACMAGGSRSFLSRRIQMISESHRSGSRLVVVATALVSSLALAGAAHATRGVSALVGEPRVAISAPPSFDPRIEAIASEALTAAVARSKARAGFVLVSDPATGRLLAASRVDLRRGAEWTVDSPVSPASSIKPIIAAAAIQHGATTFDAIHRCENGRYETGGRLYRDWKAFDRLTTSEMVVRSSSICGIKVAERLGAERLHAVLADFGFGAAAAGTLPDIALGSATKDGFHATPLELVQAFGAFANDGKLMAPIAWNAPDSDVRVVREVLSPGVAAGMRDVLERAVTEGTGSNARSDRWTTAGKTSSSSAGAGSLAGFIGHAPAVSPRVVIYVGIVEPEGPVHGNGQAAPAFREVAEGVLAHLGIPSDKPR